jgi:hypothetical protein
VDCIEEERRVQGDKSFQVKTAFREKKMDKTPETNT